MPRTQNDTTNKTIVQNDETKLLLQTIEEQGRQTLELVRALVGLLMPKEGIRDGPSLEELLAALIVQQRETVALLKTIHADQLRLADSVPRAVADAVEEQLSRAKLRT